MAISRVIALISVVLLLTNCDMNSGNNRIAKAFGNGQEVELGMSYDEVTSALGKPDHIIDNKWYYDKTGKIAIFDDGQLSAISRGTWQDSSNVPAAQTPKGPNNYRCDQYNEYGNFPQGGGCNQNGCWLPGGKCDDKGCSAPSLKCTYGDLVR